MKKQKNNEKKEKVLKILKYIGIGLAWSVLLVGFLALLINGVKGCSNKSDTKTLKHRDNYVSNVLASNGVDLDNYDVYESIFNDSTSALHSVSVALQQKLTTQLNLSALYNADEVPYGDDVRFNYYPNNSYIIYNGDLSQITRIQVRFSIYNYSESETRYCYRLNSINIFAPTNIVYAAKDDSAVGDLYGYDNTYTITSLTSGYSTRFIFDSGDENPLLNTFFVISDKTTLTFGDTFNYNAAYQYLVALDVNNTGYQTITEDLTYYVFRQYDGYITTSLNASSYQLTLDLPYFYSNGFLFNQIVFNYVALADTEQVMTLNNGFVPNHYVNQQNTTLIYHSMRYKNSNSGLSLQTNIRNGGLDSNGVYYWQLTTSWANDNYKTITFISSLNEYETYFLNNMNNLTIGGGLSSGGSVFDVFTLLGNAFSSFTSLFNVAILPSITIGVLVAIPLVVSLIILLFKMIKGS